MPPHTEKRVPLDLERAISREAARERAREDQEHIREGDRGLFAVQRLEDEPVVFKSSRDGSRLMWGEDEPEPAPAAPPERRRCPICRKCRRNCQLFLVDDAGRFVNHLGQPYNPAVHGIAFAMAEGQPARPGRTIVCRERRLDCSFVNLQGRRVRGRGLQLIPTAAL